ncbi:MAG TPA: DEAD/DEAH box helicase [Herbaspirillum sp.]|nr:DEAD/DEAH box helicase [Herbaspirillum sp.]
MTTSIASCHADATTVAEADADADTDVLSDFHPAVAAWFRSAFPAATEAQRQAWPLIRSGRPTLVAAPTGSGKTLTAFLAAIDELVCAGAAANGTLPDATTVLYISPLKALSNDIRLNLQLPLEGIAAELIRMGLPDPGIRAAVRTGDTTAPERMAMRKRAPHILVTTPESLYVLLCSDSGRAMLAAVRTVIVDEIHAVAGNKRGSHLALSLERLDALCPRRPTRIGLSATQKPLDAVARFLVGSRGDGDGNNDGDCAIVDVGHIRRRDLAIEVPPMPLEAVMANDVWERVYDRMAELVVLHRTTLIFVNTRRMAERAARHLAERLGAQAVAAHHGSLAKEYRLDAEQRLKRGELRVLIATASLELGIDIGDVDLVCQVGSPRSIAALLQRVGRSGHQVGGMPKGRLFPSSRDDLIECAALLDCIRRDELDMLHIPQAPLDVLAQQIVAEVACREWSEEALFALIRRASPYAQLPRAQYDAIVRMLTEGTTGRYGVRGSYLHRDTVAGTLRGRRGAKLTAVTSGGTIPDNADYAVILEPQGHSIGTVNEDFAVESIAGDVFQLGNTSYRILRIETGRVRVEDAHGAAPSIPFWLGEAPGRSDALSAGVARLRATIDGLLAGASGTAGLGAAAGWLIDAVGIDDAAARQIVDYLARSRAALGALPTQDTLAMERFFDESGGMQLVLHAPFGSRINRAWGLALRKRFCRTFNFELQAAATEDTIVLSLSLSHSFVLDEVWRYLRSGNAEHVLIQALLDAPLFNVRWRWNATTALSLPRYSGGRKVAPQLQRMKSDDLLAAVFPDQAACLENVVGERTLPDHPLVQQTIDDCLHEAMDCDGWIALLKRIEQGQIKLIARDLPAPSPLAMEILNARPYAFLDDAPLEERRTQAVLGRRWSDPAAADDLGALDADAIVGVAEEAWPQASNPDEMHEALMRLACIAESEARRQENWPQWLDTLARGGRATRMHIPDRDDALWVPLERLACLQAIYPGMACAPQLKIPQDEHGNGSWERDDAIVEVVRARLSGFGPQPLPAIAQPLGLQTSTVAAALIRLETEGYVMRGRFTPAAADEEWCERHLLARIHRYTIKRLRREIEPVEPRDFMRFLFDWQHLTPDTQLQGIDALSEVIAQLEGFEIAAGAWESEVLPARISDYSASWLDDLCRTGKVVWTRIARQIRTTGTSGGPVRNTGIVLLPRRHLRLWNALPNQDGPRTISARAQRVHAALLRDGAMFFDELLADTDTRLLPTELETALGELVSNGLVNADSFAGLRALLLPAAKRAIHARRRRQGRAIPAGMEETGRWAPLRHSGSDADVNAGGKKARTEPQVLEHIARVLLRRYGVVCWRVLEREAGWLPAWRELLPVLHRLEARGDIRGGRFVAGLVGEQFALPEAIALLREVRRRPADGSLISVSGVDPLNLAGTLLPGDKIAALTGNRLVFLDGMPVAALVAGKAQTLIEVAAHDKERVRAALAGRR